MTFTKGYATENGFIPEGSCIKVVFTTGEVIEGALLKPAKKEFRLEQEESLTRVIKVEDVQEIKTN